MTPGRAFLQPLRTITTAAQCIGHRQWPRPSWQQTCQRTTFAAETTKRRFPGHEQSTRRKNVQRQIAIGLFAGGAAFLLYKVYSIKRMRDSFAPYKLIRKDPVSSTASIFVLEPEGSVKDAEQYSKAWQAGIWNVQFKQPQLQIVRPYTPLPPSEDARSENELRFLIRNDVNGEVSSYLHRLPIGSRIELRGPDMEYDIPASVKQVVFFAGGTGIAPAFQTAHALFRRQGPTKDRTLHILWASRKREDCVGGHSDHTPAEPLALRSRLTSIFSSTSQPPVSPSLPTSQPPENQGLIVKELERLKEQYPGQITVEYYVNEDNNYINSTAVCKALARFDDYDFSAALSSTQDQRQILISGPPGFISYLAGPKEWKNGKEQQGGISKILAHAISMNPHNVKIWKI